MSYYRIYEYPEAEDLPLKHILLKRERGYNSDVDRGRSILDHLEDFKKSEESLSRAKRSIRDLMLCNKFDYFCTFTFSPDSWKVNRYDLSSCKRYIAKWFNNIKSRVAPDLRYIIIPEYHEDGAVHFHGVIGGLPEGELVVPPFIYKRVMGELQQLPNTPGYMDWPRWHRNAGFFNCSPIRNYTKCAFYVTKYITKHMLNMPKESSLFMCSKGLNRPELVFDVDDVPMLLDSTFSNDFVEIAYSNRDCDHVILDQEPDTLSKEDEEAIWSDDHIYFVPYYNGGQLTI